MIWEFLSPTFGIFCPQLLGIVAPNFGIFCPQLLGNWGFLSPTFRDLGIGDKNSQTVGDNNSIPMGIIIVGDKKSQKLGTKIPQRLGTKIPKSPKVGDKNSQIPKSWGQKFPKVGDNNSQKLGTKNPKSQKVGDKNSQKLGTIITKLRVNNYPNLDKIALKKTW